MLISRSVCTAKTESISPSVSHPILIHGALSINTATNNTDAPVYITSTDRSNLYCRKRVDASSPPSANSRRNIPERPPPSKFAIACSVTKKDTSPYCASPSNLIYIGTNR